MRKRDPNKRSGSARYVVYSAAAASQARGRSPIPNIRSPSATRSWSRRSTFPADIKVTRIGLVTLRTGPSRPMVIRRLQVNDVVGDCFAFGERWLLKLRQRKLRRLIIREKPQSQQSRDIVPLQDDGTIHYRREANQSTLVGERPAYDADLILTRRYGDSCGFDDRVWEMQRSCIDVHGCRASEISEPTIPRTSVRIGEKNASFAASPSKNATTSCQ